jgi:hypothetical protein
MAQQLGGGGSPALNENRIRYPTLCAHNIFDLLSRIPPPVGVRGIPMYPPREYVGESGVVLVLRRFNEKMRRYFYIN